MCGIFAASNKKRFLELYDLNVSRGMYSYGGLYVAPGSSYIIDKQKGGINPDLIPEGLKYYFGHTRAPTTGVKDFRADNSHPFISGNYIAAHNGIISNFEKLKVRHLYRGEVDSGIIPWIANHTESITKTLSELEGTFGVWIYDAKWECAYIARCASTVWLNEELWEVSSVEIPGAVMIKEGTTKQINFRYNEIRDSEQFTFKSPYFIP